MTHSKTILDMQKEMRAKLKGMVATCTAGQQEMFELMYPQGVPDDKLDWALAQVERTITINEDRRRCGQAT